MSDSEDTPEKHRGLVPWAPGQSGNPLGRPKGSRNKLGEDFIKALAEDFERHGPATIQTVRAERPHEYLKVVASLLPKHVEIKDATLDELGRDDIAALLDAVRAAGAARNSAEQGSRH